MDEQDGQSSVGEGDLARRISNELAVARGAFRARPRSVLLWVDDQCSATPAQLIADKLLEAVDKVTWLGLTQCTRQASRVSRFPTYRKLAEITNVSSTETVARTIAILRCRRWLTAVQRIERAGARRAITAYAAHAAPLTAEMTLRLDPHYLRFVQRMLSFRHSRVRQVAEVTMSEMTAGGHDAAEPQADQQTLNFGPKF